VHPGSPLEARIIRVLNEIAKEKHVAETLDAFRQLSGGKYWKMSGDHNALQDFPLDADQIQVRFIPGNHDRLANATPTIRRTVRDLLGLAPSDGPFENCLFFDNPPILVRHGHEYDRYNFSADYAKSTRIPRFIPQREYDDATLGDFITVSVAARLPYLFRQYHTDSAIVANSLLSAVYRRILEFDDVRPQSAVLNFMLTMPGVKQRDVWECLEPVLKKLLDENHDHPFLRTWLSRLELKWRPDWIDLCQAYLDTMSWKLGIPLKEAQILFTALKGGSAGPEAVHLAASEEVITSGMARCVIAGHTHEPQVSLVAADANYGERYYIDTGTWRNRVLPTAKQNSFGRLKALTYIIVYRSDEDQNNFWSFDYWDGFTQRWSA
jgi:UDP-2,3-diacylglucosamine pyrophosphatase LpxH